MRHGKPKTSPSPQLETAYEQSQRERKEAQELAKGHQSTKPIKYLLK